MQVNDREQRGQKLGELCSELVRRLRLLERTEVACCGVPLSQAMVLQTLHASGGSRRMSEVAEALGVAQSTATRLVEPLVRDGQVRRQPAADDGRVVMARLTPRGQRTAAELDRLSLRWSAGILQRIPAARHDSVIAALELVVAAVNDCCATGCEPDLIQIETTSTAISG